MAVDRIHSSDTQVFINSIRLSGVQSMNIANELQFEELQNIGSYQVYDRILTNNQKSSVSIDFLLLDSAPNNLAANSVQDPFYTFAQTGFLSIDSFNIKKRDLAGEQILQSGYLTSYNIKCAIGEVVNGSISYECDGYSYSTGNALTYYSQTQDSGVPFLPQKISITSDFDNGVTSSGFNIQSFSLDIPISRQPVYLLGRLNPEYRYPELPANGTITFSVIKNSVTGVDLTPLILEKGSLTINMAGCTSQTKLRYKINNCSLQSISESQSLDDNSTIDFNYVFSINSGTFLERKINP